MSAFPRDMLARGNNPQTASLPALPLDRKLSIAIALAGLLLAYLSFRRGSKR